MSETDGTVWDIKRVVSVTDGDSVRLVRSRLVNYDGRHYRMTDADEIRGFPIRLTWLDTPERGDHPGYENAKADLNSWIAMRAVLQIPLFVICYESAGWDRILGNLTDANGQSASEWMLKDRGWPPFIEGK